MTVRQAVRASLDLLSVRDRRRLALITLAQMSTAFLDLLGVVLVGVVTALSLSVMTATPPPAMVTTAVDLTPLASMAPETQALVLACVAGLLLIGKSLVNMWLTRRILRFLARRQAWVSRNLAAELLSKPLLQVQERSSQQTVYALTTGVSYATVTILSQTAIALSEIALLSVLAVGLLAISPVVTLFTIAFFLAIAWTLQRVLAHRAGRIGRNLGQIDVDSIESVQEALRAYREAVVSQRRGYYVQRFQDLRMASATNSTELQFLNMVPKYVLEVALVVGASLLAASQLLTRDVTAAVAIIAVFLAAGSRIVPSLLRLQTAAIISRGAAGQAQPTFELAAQLAATTANPAGAPGSPHPISVGSRPSQSGPFTDFDASIEVRRVHLRYPDASVPTLVNVSLHLPAGGSLALVGPTGAGKTTLADVILGVIEPDTGEVLIGGLSPLQAVATWPGAIAYVPQIVAMANGTVRENVALGLPRDLIDDSAVWAALRRAHLEDFLRTAREGLDTIIGEHGLKLSGGQRQRLGIARALYTHPRLLILDEATSALDAETERLISQTLRDLAGEVTTVTIAHRLATIRHCDLIVYLEQGRLVAAGTFDEVRGASENFRNQAALLGL